MTTAALRRALAAALLFGTLSTGALVAQTPLTTRVDSVSYIYGVNIANQLKSMPSFGFNVDQVIAGIRDVVGGKVALTDDQMRACINAYERDVTAAQQQMGQQMQQAGLKLLADNAKRAGVKTTATGLQYEVIAAGNGRGKRPTAASQVTVHYTGMHVDGKVFDSSVERGQPTSFPLNGVIKGWTEGLQLMQEGDKYRFFIPSALAYGAEGRSPSIGPNEVLVFDVELIKVN